MSQYASYMIILGRVHRAVTGLGNTTIQANDNDLRYTLGNPAMPLPLRTVFFQSTLSHNAQVQLVRDPCQEPRDRGRTQLLTLQVISSVGLES